VPTYRDEAIVLRTHKLGEADRIITMFTRVHGKVRAVAKGVRRTSSRIRSRLEPFMVADVRPYGGRNLDIVTQVETNQPFASAIAADYRVYTAATAASSSNSPTNGRRTRLPRPQAPRPLPHARPTNRLGRVVPHRPRRTQRITDRPTATPLPGT
jgi:hypothetical protein